jgi:hypothetical protein
VWNETTEFRAKEARPLPAVGELSLVCRIFDQGRGNVLPRRESELSSALQRRDKLSSAASTRDDRRSGKGSSGRYGEATTEVDEGQLEQQVAEPIGVVSLPLTEVVTLPNRTFEGWLPLRPSTGDTGGTAGRGDEQTRGGGRRSTRNGDRDRARDAGRGRGKGKGSSRDRDRDTGRGGYDLQGDDSGDEEQDDDDGGGEFGLGELKVVVELLVPKVIPDSDDDDDDPVAEERSAREAIDALQDAIDGTAVDWRSVCTVASKRVQIGPVLREDADKPAAADRARIKTRELTTAELAAQGQIQLPPLLAAVVSGQVRWCKVCKVAFGSAQCPNSHAIFHYTKMVPPDVLAVLQMEARLTTLRLKWAALDPATRVERAAAMLQAVVRGKMGRRRAFAEDQWRRMGLKITSHANRDRSRRLHIAGRRPPSRRYWHLRWAVPAELRHADSKGLAVAVPVGRTPRSRHALLAARPQVVRVQPPGQRLRPLFAFTQFVELSGDIIDYYKARDTLDPDEPRLSDIYKLDRRTAAPYERRRARALFAAASKGGLLPPPVYRRVPMGTPEGSRFRITASLLAQTQPESALGSLVRERKQLAVELRRLQLLRPGQDRRCRTTMVQTLLRGADRRMDTVAAVALQAAWRGSRRRAAVRAICGPIVARDAAAVGLSDSAHKTWGQRATIPPMKLVLQVLAARVQKTKIDSLRADVLAHQPPAAADSGASPTTAATDTAPFVTVRYWKDSLLALERGSASDDIVRLVMDVGASRRVFKARRPLLLAGLPKFREEVEVRGSTQLRRRVKLEPGDAPETIEQLIGYVHGETVRLNQHDIVAFISAARHYGARGEAYERMIRGFSELLNGENCCVLMDTAGAAADEARSQPAKRAAQRLAALCMRYILDHLDEVTQSGEIVRLPEESLLVILKSEQLRVRSEGDILKLAISWVQYDVKARASALDQIRPLIRWPNIPQPLMYEYSNNALLEAQRADVERERAVAAAAAAKKAAEAAEEVERTFSKKQNGAQTQAGDGAAVEIAVDKEWEAWKLSEWRVVRDVVVRVTVNEGSDYVGKLRPDAQLTALEEVETAKGFLRIRFEDCEGLSGWVSSRGADGAPMLEKVEQQTAVAEDRETQLRWVCGLSPLILTDERALMSLLSESGEVRSVDLSSVHRMVSCDHSVCDWLRACLAPSLSSSVR